MRIFQYEQVVSHWTLQMLKTEVEFFNEHMDRNAWIGLFDEPDNPIEQFIFCLLYTSPSPRDRG